MKKGLGFILLLSIANVANAGDIYKCNINGSVTYQAKPCKGTGTKLDLPQSPTTTKSNSNSNASNNNVPTVNRENQESEASKKAGLAIAQEAYQMTKNR